jgi:hypothetical protein
MGVFTSPISLPSGDQFLSAIIYHSPCHTTISATLIQKGLPATADLPNSLSPQALEAFFSQAARHVLNHRPPTPLSQPLCSFCGQQPAALTWKNSPGENQLFACRECYQTHPHP